MLPESVHILAYIGNQRWIEADPELGAVVEIFIPSDEATRSTWFTAPVRIVCWNTLTP